MKFLNNEPFGFVRFNMPRPVRGEPAAAAPSLAI